MSMLKDSLRRLLAKVSIDSNNLPLTLVTVGMLRLAPIFAVSFELSKFHDCFELLVKIPVVIRTS